MPTAYANPDAEGINDKDHWLSADDTSFEILPIDLAHHKLGDYTKQPFLTEKEIAEAKAEYEEDWENMLYGDYCSVGTLKEFKRKTFKP